MRIEIRQLSRRRVFVAAHATDDSLVHAFAIAPSPLVSITVGQQP
jgi:hypothetical protein